MSFIKSKGYPGSATATASLLFRQILIGYLRTAATAPLLLLRQILTGSDLAEDMEQPRLWIEVIVVTALVVFPYDSCVKSNLLESHTSSNDNITLDTAGDKYYVCGNGTQCAQGRKLTITVLAASGRESEGGDSGGGEPEGGDSGGGEPGDESPSSSNGARSTGSDESTAPTSYHRDGAVLVAACLVLGMVNL